MKTSVLVIWLATTVVSEQGHVVSGLLFQHGTVRSLRWQLRTAAVDLA